MSKVVLRIAQNILCSLTSASDAKAQETDIEKSPDTLKTGHLIIIDQELERLKPFAKDAGWIMDIAETLFGRKNNGRLWLLPEPNQQGTANDWLAVNRNDALRSGIYEFKGYGAKIVLSRMYTDAVKYPKSGSDQTSDFAQSVNLRHWNKCAVTGINRLSSSCTASHLTLRRLGHVPTQRIIERSETDVTWPRAHENSRAGVLLIDNIDRLVDSFRAGFYTPDPSNPYVHVVHNFSTANVDDVSILGIPKAELEPLQITNVQSLHGTNSKIENLVPATGSIIYAPPTIVFQWHYLQCVLKRFATPDYKNFPNITW